MCQLNYVILNRKNGSIHEIKNLHSDIIKDIIVNGIDQNLCKLILPKLIEYGYFNLEEDKRYHFRSDVKIIPYSETQDYLISPISIMVETTGVCNLRCIYCFVYNTINNINAKSLDMDKDTFKKLIDDIIELQPVVVQFTGGETLYREKLYGDLFDSIKKLKEADIDTEIYTNGIFLQDYIDRITTLKIKEIKISLDSIEDSTISKITSRSIRSESILISIQRLLNNGVALKVNCVVIRDNINELPNFIKKLVQIGIKKINLIRGIPIGDLSRKKDFIIPIKEWNSIFGYLKREISIDGVEIKDINKKSNTNTNISTDEMKICKAGHSYMLIKQNGDVSICTYLKDKIIANIKNRNLTEIWHDKTIWNDIRKRNGLCKKNQIRQNYRITCY